MTAGLPTQEFHARIKESEPLYDPISLPALYACSWTDLMMDPEVLWFSYFNLEVLHRNMVVGRGDHTVRQIRGEAFHVQITSRSNPDSASKTKRGNVTIRTKYYYVLWADDTLWWDKAHTLKGGPVEAAWLAEPPGVRMELSREACKGHSRMQPYVEL
jgi:hypothetical protein